MSMEPPCSVAQDGDTIHRYLADTLLPNETESFEIHLLGCAHCQAAVREGAEIRAGFSAAASGGLEPEVAVGERELGVHRMRWVRWALPAAAAATLLFVLPRGYGPLQRLGRLESPPTFQGTPVRSQGDSATVLADRGMAAYSAGDYGRAAELLEASSLLEGEPGKSFFHGISLLMIGEPEAAVDALTEAMDPADNPYALEAHFYAAKVLLSLGLGEPALEHLEIISRAEPGSMALLAIALADSVRTVLAR